MKHEIGIEKRPTFQEVWPNQYEVFSWLEYAISIPYPTYLVTTLKENGKANACWHSWGCLAGEGQGYCSVLTLGEGGHTYANVLRMGEWCINLPTLDQQAQCYKTVEHNRPDNDEITDAGFTAEPSQVIQAPRIAECLINLECRLEWHRPLFEGSREQLCVGKIVHLAMDERACVVDPRERLKALNTMYNVRSTLDPLTGRVAPGGLGIVRMS
jgi:flavin reductase (DIM6/NTAB) family NADH-FMN oxidoreductase RutF